MEDKIDLILFKIKELEKKMEETLAAVESHRVEHGFQKMQDGGINANFDVGGAQQSQNGWPQPGPGQQGLSQGFQNPGMGAPQNSPQGFPGPPPGFGQGGQDPSRPPGM
tara:strand:+ start:69 stop:395 length:327 start_codon:yes stop_codon:yes gene_type:complete